MSAKIAKIYNASNKSYHKNTPADKKSFLHNPFHRQTCYLCAK